MNRVRQLSTQLNRVNAVACEALDATPPQLVPDALTKMSPMELAELSHPLPVVNMPYLREVVVKFIGFPRGSSERACLLPVMKMLLSLGQREMKVGGGEGGRRRSFREICRIRNRVEFQWRNRWFGTMRMLTRERCLVNSEIVCGVFVGNRFLLIVIHHFATRKSSFSPTALLS